MENLIHLIAAIIRLPALTTQIRQNDSKHSKCVSTFCALVQHAKENRESVGELCLLKMNETPCFIFDFNQDKNNQQFIYDSRRISTRSLIVAYLPVLQSSFLYDIFCFFFTFNTTEESNSTALTYFHRYFYV